MKKTNMWVEEREFYSSDADVKETFIDSASDKFYRLRVFKSRWWNTKLHVHLSSVQDVCETRENNKVQTLFDVKNNLFV